MSDQTALSTFLARREFPYGPAAMKERNARLHERVLRTLDEVRARRASSPPMPFASYRFSRFSNDLNQLLSQHGIGEPQLTFIDRAKFGDDLCIKIPNLLKELGNKAYVADIVPKITSILLESPLVQAGVVTGVRPTGIYVNLAVSDPLFIELLQDVLHVGPRYGESDALHGQDIMVDYSSPNAAKKLHAGHIRSTILGEVLCNLYEAAGATAHRLNHINDLGGFGFYLEGFARWHQHLPEAANKNDQLATLYRLNRTLEKVYEENRFGDALSKEEAHTVEILFGAGLSAATFRERYQEYVAAANRKFEALEGGDPEVVALWARMVGWSLDDFEQFYGLLNVRHDYVLGESFYAPLALALLNAAGDRVMQFDQARAVAAKERVAALEQSAAITALEAEHRRKAIQDDVGALVVELSNDRRLVVLRSDGRTIYASRDLGAILYRTMFVHPSRMVYVVGQEQKEHFEDVFEAARVLGIDGGTRFDHLYFGFYVDAASKKKLSSRDGASNVIRLLTEAIAFFAKKFDGRDDFSPDEVTATSRQLAIGSVIFNDLKKDRKNNVELASDLQKVFEDFEKAGGAYVMYTACRARSILRKAPPSIDLKVPLGSCTLEDSEREIIKKIAAFPEQVATAAQRDDPASLLNALLDLCRLYNSYYNAVPVLKGGTVHVHRLLLTEAVMQTLVNGLRFCHISCPERI